MENYNHYIKELRNRFRLVVILFVISFLSGFLLFKQLLTLFLKVFYLENVQITVTSPYQVFNLALNTGLFLAVVIVSPLVITQFLLFVKPALTPKESVTLIQHFILALFLYLFGFIFGLALSRYVVLGLSNTFSMSQVSNYWDISVFLSQVFLTAAFLGLAFQFPVAMSIFTKLGWVEVEKLEEKRPFFIAGSLLFMALLPPTDGVSLVLMILPVIILYEVTLLFLKRGRKAVIAHAW